MFLMVVIRMMGREKLFLFFGGDISCTLGCARVIGYICVDASCWLSCVCR